MPIDVVCDVCFSMHQSFSERTHAPYALIPGRLHVPACTADSRTCTSGSPQWLHCPDLAHLLQLVSTQAAVWQARKSQQSITAHFPPALHVLLEVRGILGHELLVVALATCVRWRMPNASWKSQGFIQKLQVSAARVLTFPVIPEVRQTSRSLMLMLQT